MDNCPVCFEEMKMKCITSCHHVICIECLLKLRKSDCPLCRKNLALDLPNNLMKIINNNTNKKGYINNSDIINWDDFPPLQ